MRKTSSICLGEQARGDVARIRKTIEAMRRTETHFAAHPGEMWYENIKSFEYLLSGDDLSPFERLRQETHHITGDPGRKLPRVSSGHIRPANLVYSLAHRMGLMDSRTERALHFRTWLRGTPTAMRLAKIVTEPKMLGGGEIPSSIIEEIPYNFETARFLVEITNIAELGFPLDTVGLKIMDIGSGWGGLAYFLRVIYPDSHITLVDLPETFIFSMSYLMLGDPEKTFYLAEDGICDPSKAVDADYAFFSPGVLERLPDQSIDLIINTGSMAEMSHEQVQYYIGQIKRVGRGTFYSFNEDRQSRNSQLVNLTEMLKKEFAIKYGRHTFSPFHSIVCKW